MLKPGVKTMPDTDLAQRYAGYIACLNRQDWPALGQFVHEDVHYNDQLIGLDGYRRMLEQDFQQIPDLRFTIELLVADAQRVASRLTFTCTPVGTFMGLAVNGRTVHFTENVFYQFRDGKIERVWSVIDKAAIEAQLLTGSDQTQAAHRR